MVMTTKLPGTPQDYLNKPYARQLTPDESGGYVATILEFPGCIAEGDTPDEALENLNNAAESWIEAALAGGQYIRDPIDFGGFSGKLALRLPRTLHRQAAELAELEKCSLNQLLVTAIALYVGGKPLADKIAELASRTNQLHMHIYQIAPPGAEATAFANYQRNLTTATTASVPAIAPWPNYAGNQHIVPLIAQPLKRRE
jgi:predicted RNase H-like HicB family nuclease